MDSPLDSPLDSAREGPVAVLTLNRPERRNALSPQLIEALGDALGVAEADPEVRAIVLAATGTHFCAGGDLGPQGLGGDGFLAAHNGRGGFVELLKRLHRGRTPVVAAVAGDTMGGGCGLVAACHLVVAAESARFSTPELNVGLFPMMISPILARNLPRKVLMEMILAGRKLGAPEAAAFGFVNRVVPAERVAVEAMGLAERVASRSPSVVALGLSAMAVTEDLDLDAALAYMHAQLTLNLMTDDAAEGITAFVTRRKPSWKGS